MSYYNCLQEPDETNSKSNNIIVNETKSKSNNIIVNETKPEPNEKVINNEYDNLFESFINLTKSYEEIVKSNLDKDDIIKALTEKLTIINAELDIERSKNDNLTEHNNMLSEHLKIINHENEINSKRLDAYNEQNNFNVENNIKMSRKVIALMNENFELKELCKLQSETQKCKPNLTIQIPDTYNSVSHSSSFGMGNNSFGMDNNSFGMDNNSFGMDNSSSFRVINSVSQTSLQTQNDLTSIKFDIQGNHFESNYVKSNSARKYISPIGTPISTRSDSAIISNLNEVKKDNRNNQRGQHNRTIIKREKRILKIIDPETNIEKKV